MDKLTQERLKAVLKIVIARLRSKAAITLLVTALAAVGVASNEQTNEVAADVLDFVATVLSVFAN
jgi:hypothetical protein